MIIISLNLKLLFIFKYKSRAKKKEIQTFNFEITKEKSNPTSVTKYLRPYLYNPEQHIPLRRGCANL